MLRAGSTGWISRFNCRSNGNAPSANLAVIRFCTVARLALSTPLILTTSSPPDADSAESVDRTLFRITSPTCSNTWLTTSVPHHACILPASPIIRVNIHSRSPFLLHPRSRSFGCMPCPEGPRSISLFGQLSPIAEHNTRFMVCSSRYPSTR